MKCLIRIFLLHFFILAIYIAITSYLFVIYRYYDPVGMGIQQWFCFILHFLFTGIIALIIVVQSKDKDGAKKSLVAGLSAVVIWWALYLLFSAPWQCLLDRLRG